MTVSYHTKFISAEDDCPSFDVFITDGDCEDWISEDEVEGAIADYSAPGAEIHITKFTSDELFAWS